MMYFLNKYKWIFLAVLIFFVFPIALYLFTSKSQSPIPVPNTTINIPTPFIASSLQVIRVLPFQGEADVNPYATISATFSRSLTPLEKKAVLVSFSPKLSGQTSLNWSKDNTSFVFTHTIAFGSSVTYSAIISYRGGSFSWGFTTIALEDLPQDQQLNLQSQWDQQWADHQDQIQTDFPWYNQLPLYGNEYFVLFNTQSRVFDVQLHPDSSSSIPQDQQVTALQQTVRKELENIGIDTTKYQLNWNITPE